MALVAEPGLGPDELAALEAAITRAKEQGA
jgi:hypothetical protein